MTHLTDEELDALVEQQTRAANKRDEFEALMNAGRTVRAITALRAQLADAKADCDKAWKVAHASTDRGMKAEARAVRAEAALAALESAPHVNEKPKNEHDGADVLTALEPAPATPAEAAKDVLAERQRQISTEGWTPEHDDTHINREMAQAAACYTLNAAGWKTEALRECWPRAWASAWFKPTDQRHNLVKAGALILAEIERLDRAALRAIEETTK